MKIDDSMIAAPAAPSPNARNTPREATVSSRNQKPDFDPKSVPDMKDLARDAFKKLPVTIPGEQPTTTVNKIERAEPEAPKPEAPVRETNKQKSEKPDPRVTERMERTKAAQDVWSKIPTTPTEEAKPVETPAAEATDTDASQASQEDPYANIKDNDWKALKAAARNREAEAKKQAAEYQAKLDKAEADLAKYRTNIPNPEEAEKLRAENKAALDRLALLDFQSHPEYRRNFVEPKQKVADQVKMLLTDNQIEGVDIDALVSKPRIEFAKAVSEIEGKMNSFDAGEFRASMRELAKLDQAAKAAVGTHQQMAEGLKQQSEARARQAFESAYSEHKAWSPVPFKIEAGLEPEKAAALEEFNKAASQIRVNAERYAFSPSDEKTSSSIALKAAQFDFYVRHGFPQMAQDYKAAKETIAELSAQLKDLQAKRPGAHDATSAPSGDSGAKKEEPKSFREAAAAVWRR
jgi:hypothetical protein